MWFDGVFLAPHPPHSPVITKANPEINRVCLPVPDIEPWMDHASTIVCGVERGLHETLISSPSEVAHDLLSSVTKVDAPRRRQKVIALPIREHDGLPSLAADDEQENEDYGHQAHLWPGLFSGGFSPEAGNAKSWFNPSPTMS
ncbi:MAG: hypothetical protein KJ072_22645 [Verrucomicrobia bacterium]|nr:hypothetical protein [Verrucomicrobiota bacterium]